jgi:signal peptidase
MSEKTKKIVNIVVDVVVAIVLVFVFILAISAITSKAKGYDGYSEIFGKAYVAVESDSMSGDGEDNFSRGDLIVIKTLSQDEVKDLKVGDIITFRTNQITDDDTFVLNTHRIVEIDNSGSEIRFVTKGDHNVANDSGTVSASLVVGLYQGKASGIGHVFLFMRSSTGFFVCVVLPSLLIVVYFAINLVVVILKEKKLQSAAAQEEKQKEHDLIMEQARAAVMAELAAKDKDNKEDKQDKE